MRNACTETIFSLSGEVPPLDPAGGPPALEMLETGALFHGSARELCFVRKISGGGAVLHVDSVLEIGERLELELMSGQSLQGVVAWRRGSEAGLRFDEPLDVFAIIARNLVSQAGERRRMPRIELRCAGRLESPAGSEAIATRDISQGGARIETKLPLESEQNARLTLDGFLPIQAVVRWCDGGMAGLAFTPELGWQELMPWLKERRDRAWRRSSSPTSAPVPPQQTDGTLSLPSEGSVHLNLPARVREGTHRWKIDVASITTRQVEFESFAALRLGTLLWIVLPGLEGWPARIIAMDGYRYTCEFTQPLHPAVLERVLEAVRTQDG